MPLNALGPAPQATHLAQAALVHQRYMRPRLHQHGPGAPQRLACSQGPGRRVSRLAHPRMLQQGDHPGEGKGAPHSACVVSAGCSSPDRSMRSTTRRTALATPTAPAGSAGDSAARLRPQQAPAGFGAATAAAGGTGAGSAAGDSAKGAERSTCACPGAPERAAVGSPPAGVGLWQQLLCSSCCSARTPPGAASAGGVSCRPSRSSAYPPSMACAVRCTQPGRR